MTEADRIEAMRSAAREVLRELLPELLQGERAAGPDPVIPLVPAPPVAAVMRPSTWTAPAGPGETIGDDQLTTPAGPGETIGDGHLTLPAAASPPAAETAGQSAAPPIDGTRIEAVTLDSDADLQRFVASLLTRLESPRERRALRTGRLRFTLRRAADVPTPQRAGAASPPRTCAWTRAR